MKDPMLSLNPNELIKFLDKAPEDFTKKDLIRFIDEKEIEMINFRYIDADGRLKNLNFVITSRIQLEKILSRGERADGSNIFPYFRVGASDLYLLPKYKTAFINPFAEIPSLEILCALFYQSGDRLEISPEYILKKAHDSLKKDTGLILEAMGELEYYVISDSKTHLYPGESQKGYHESAPFNRYESLRTEAMKIISKIGGKIKYGHSEVGDIEDNGKEMEQHEIEFEPRPIEDMADQLTIAKWVLRMLGNKYGVTISFAPKILIGHAGNGLHIHSRLMKNGKNAMVDGNGLNDVGRRLIAGYIELASALTAFGNTVPTSYLRLVPHQEAPTNICWGERNRAALIRVPLGWINVKSMIEVANPKEKGKYKPKTASQTVEFRCPDGSSNIYLLLAGLAVAARYGLKNKDSLKVAEKFYVGADACFADGIEMTKKMPKLPTSCYESAEVLLKNRKIFEEQGVFPSNVIDGLAGKLKNYNDKNLQRDLKGKKVNIRDLLQRYLHCG